MHLGILALMVVGPFSVITFAWYTTLWGPDDYAALGRRISRR